MTQTERVLAASRSYRGVSAVDFQLPHIVDGGKPILRVAARIYDLESQGYAFERLPNRHGCAVYRLIAEPKLHGTPLPREGKGAQPPEIPSSSPRLRTEPAAGTLFEPESRRPRKHYEEAA